MYFLKNIYVYFFFLLKATRNKKKDYSTWYSRVVPHRSTNHAHRGLTSQIGRDGVLSARYGRNRKLPIGEGTYTIS